jgi:plastocyanin
MPLGDNMLATQPGADDRPQRRGAPVKGGSSVAQFGLRILILSLVLLVGTACGGGAAASGGSASQSFTVDMNDANQFRPADVTVPKGATVTWTNSGQVIHTVTDDPLKAINKSDAVLPGGAQPWDSGNVDGGARYSHTFDVAGQYTYFCIPHEALGMVGHVTVSG